MKTALKKQVQQKFKFFRKQSEKIRLFLPSLFFWKRAFPTGKSKHLALRTTRIPLRLPIRNHFQSSPLVIMYPLINGSIYVWVMNAGSNGKTLIGIWLPIKTWLPTGKVRSASRLGKVVPNGNLLPTPIWKALDRIRTLHLDPRMTS